MEESKKDDLFELIHCLSPAQKGFFSKFAQRHELKDGNNYEQLFQILSKMPAYDGDAVASELKRLGIRTPLPAAKNHLKSIILRAMRDYNSSRDTHTTLLEGLQNLAFLYEQKQYDLLRKELKRLKKIAGMFSEYHILFKIGDYERRLHKETARRDIMGGMEEILSEMQLQAKAFQNQLQFDHLMDKMFIIASRAGADQEQALNALLATELLASEENATTLFSRISYHQIHAIAYMIRGQFPASQKKYGAVVSLWEGAPHLIEEYPLRYRRILSNYLQICGQTGDYAILEQLLAKVRSSPATQRSDKAEIFSIGNTAELQWRIGTQDWDGVAAMIPSVTAGLANFADLLRPNTVQVIKYYLASYYFLAQDYRACNKWLREITEAPRSEHRMDIQRVARLLGLIILWVKKEEDLLEYELRSVSRYFEHWGGGELEQAVLHLFESLLEPTGRAAEKQLLHALATKIGQGDGKGFLGDSLIQAWAIAQTTGASPREVIAQLEGKPAGGAGHPK